MFGDTAFCSLIHGVFISILQLRTVVLFISWQVVGWHIEKNRFGKIIKKCFLCGGATIVISCPMEKLGFCVCCSNISLEAQSHRIQQSWNSQLHMELLLFTGTCLLLCLSGSSLVHTLISYLLKGCIFLHGLHKYWKSFLTVCVEQPNLYQW